MWITRLQLYHDDCPIVNRCAQFNLIVLSYPSHWYKKRGNTYAVTMCYFQGGEEKNKKAFLKDLKKDKRITNMETSGDFFTYEINLGKKGRHVMLHYDRKTFFVRPTINHADGHEYWEIAAWKKESLNEFIKKT